MLVNMPTTSIGNTLSNMESNNTAAQNSCVEYNYLKRKLNTDDILSQQQTINNINENGNSNNDGSCPVTLWKKRHLEVQMAAPAATTNNFGQILTDHTNQNSSCKQSNHNNNNINADNNNDLQFNIMSNAFINDLFSYDNNLIVPVTTTLTDATTVSFTTPASVSINTAHYVADADDANNWQATDLLELDHRYNSALQPIVEATTTTPNISQMNPTIVVNNHDQQQQQESQQQHTTQQQQQQQHQHQQQQFLVPQKQVSRSQPSTLAKYRQHFQLPQQQQQLQHAQQHPPQHQQHQHQNHEYAGHPQQSQQSPDTETDFEDKNLSWLLNFKFDELPHLSPDIGNNTTRPQTEKLSAATASAAGSAATAGSVPLEPAAAKSNSNSPSSSYHSSSSERSRSKSPKTSTKASKKFEELVMEVTAECDGSDMIVGENVVVEDYSPKAQKKPPFTYTELIEYALEDKGELTVSGIYQWISDRFPFYKSNDDRWKNSVRHNLSINPHFRKGAKAPQGAGHLWTISSGDSAENVLAWEHKKQRLDLFFKMESMNRERIQEHQQKLQKQQQQLLRQQQQQQCSTLSALHQSCHPDQCQYDEAAAAAAAITQEMLQQTNSSSSGNTSATTTSCSGGTTTVRHGFHELPFNDLMSDEELRKTAGQILNGIHREVEVQSVNSIISTYHDVLLDSDYLNPIHKDVAVNESGLRNTCHAHTSQYYITEIDPIELGIQMSHQVEEEVLFSDEFNLNYFGYNAGNDIVA